MIDLEGGETWRKLQIHRNNPSVLALYSVCIISVKYMAAWRTLIRFNDKPRDPLGAFLRSTSDLRYLINVNYPITVNPKGADNPHP
jgi:hypothetical protein